MPMYAAHHRFDDRTSGVAFTVSEPPVFSPPLIFSRAGDPDRILSQTVKALNQCIAQPGGLIGLIDHSLPCKDTRQKAVMILQSEIGCIGGGAKPLGVAIDMRFVPAIAPRRGVPTERKSNAARLARRYFDRDRINALCLIPSDDALSSNRERCARGRLWKLQLER